jgi:hypothetical protein
MSYLYFPFAGRQVIYEETLLNNMVHRVSPYPLKRFAPTLTQAPLLGCALIFASEAKFEIEAKILLRLEAKKSLISHDSLRCETPKI